MKAVDSFDQYQAAKHDLEFDRDDMLRPIKTGPFYAIEIKRGIHFTMGDVRINAKTQVLSPDKKPIPGLYASGRLPGASTAATGSAGMP